MAGHRDVLRQLVCMIQTNLVSGASWLRAVDYEPSRNVGLSF